MGLFSRKAQAAPAAPAAVKPYSPEDLEAMTARYREYERLGLVQPFLNSGWEVVNDTVMRLAVSGGHLYRVHRNYNDKDAHEVADVAPVVVFVPER